MLETYKGSLERARNAAELVQKSAGAIGTIYAGLWFPVICTALAATVALLFLPETKDRDIHA